MLSCDYLMIIVLILNTIKQECDLFIFSILSDIVFILLIQLALSFTHISEFKNKYSNLSSASGSPPCIVVGRISWETLVIRGSGLGKNIAFFCPSSYCSKINFTGLTLCSLPSLHHPTAGFAFYIASSGKHLTSP